MKKRKRKIKVIIVMLMLLVCVALVFVLGDRMFNETGGQDVNAVMGTSDNQTEKQIKKEMEKKLDKELLATSMNTSVIFKDSDSKGILNFEVKPNNYYTMRLEITLDDKDKTMLYKSGNVEPGYIIKEATLDKKLEKGTYKCKATFIALDQNKDYAEVESATAKVEIVIEK